MVTSRVVSRDRGGGRGLLCVDVDECRTFAGLCQDGSTCINTVGSFVCQCPAHMVQDFTGLGCLGK